MSSAIAVILALTLSAEPVAQAAEPRRVPRAGILLTASVGLALIGVGAGYDIYGQSVTAPNAPVAPGTASAGDGYFVGGVSMIITGLCFVLIAALLTQWYSPKSVLGVQW